VKPLWGVYGAGGCGRGLLPLLRDNAQSAGARLVFIDDQAAAPRVNGAQILRWEQFLNEESSERAVCLAVADGALRRKLWEKVEREKLGLLNIQAGNAVVMDEVEIGAGHCLSPFVTLTSNIRIGKCFHANLYSYVEHDCVIGDFVTFAPGVKCNGNVHIDDGVYVGSGAILRHGTHDKPLRIGKGAIVGMGAVVTKDVPAGVTVVGNPARILEK
jgi:sugar O-acyltransferase (sialic acid O-acetyltransferase NeuD family)